MLNALADDVSVQARHPTWHRLIHYEALIFDTEKLKSAIHSPEFFLAANGAVDPEAELLSTIAAMQEPLTGSNDEHAKCRFPARRIWLEKTFPALRDNLAAINCPAFSEWTPIGDGTSISIMFANGYLGNPASYYGHIFLKINSQKIEERLGDQTVNYGAIETSKDDPLTYIAKGLSGGYDGGFSPVDFFFHDANYGENELRDIWEYRLNLPPEEVRFIISHAWEVMKKRYVYYFFHDNCAFRVAELLEIVEGINANPKGLPWIIPQAVLQQITSGTYHEVPLLDKRTFHPSRQTRLYQRYTSLNARQKEIVAGSINMRIQISGPELKSMPVAEQHEVIDTVLDYHQFSKDMMKKGVNLSTNYVEALAARFNLPPGNAKSISPITDPPDSGKAPSWAQLGTSHHQTRGKALSLRLRPAYYDPLDVTSGQAKHGGLSMGDLEVDITGSRFRLHHFDIISINSINPAVTGLPKDQGIGWKLRMGLEQERLGCKDCLAGRLQADYTRGSLIGSSSLFGAINIGGAVQSNSNYDGYGFARIGMSLVFRPSSTFGALISHEIRRPVESAYVPTTNSSAEIRIALGKDHDLRARIERDKTTAVSIGIGTYW